MLKRILIIAFLVAAFCGCKKARTVGTTTTTTTTTIPHFVDSISVSGCLFTDEYLSFDPNIPNSFLPSLTSVVWDFGDRSPLQEITQPGHSYSAPGIYTVTVTVNKLQAVSKTIKIEAAISSSRTTAMSGLRPWVGVASGTVLEFGSVYFPNDSTIDTTFTMGVYENKKNVRFLNATLTLSASDATTLTFIDCGRAGKKLVYYYTADSMAYTHTWVEGKRSGNFNIHTR